MSCSVIRNKETNEIEKVLAPNGEDSILFRSINELEPDKEASLRLWAQVYTKSFSNWFGDWEKGEGSEVLDSNGEPLIVYHGSNNTFNEFDSSYIGSGDGRGKYGEGFYFTSNYKKAYGYRGLDPWISQEIASKLINDGIVTPTVYPVFLNIKDETSEFQIDDEYVIKNPNNIKSVFNKGEFSKENNDIYYQVTPNYDAIDKIVKGFDLIPKNKYKEFGFSTKNESQTSKIVDAINKWITNKPEFNGVRAILDKTYNLIKFQDTQNGRIFSQIPSESDTKVSPEQVGKIKDFLKQIGVKYETVSSIVIDGKKINGIANPLEALIQVVNGKEDSTLPEEAIHMAVEILEQTNPKLFNSLLSKIGSFKIYKDTLDTYRTVKAYQNSEGKPDIRKIKKEAIAKAIVETISLSSEDSTENANKSVEVQSWWKSIIDWFKSLFSKTSDPFKEVAESVIQGTFKGNINSIIDNGEFYQVSQEDTYNKLKEDSNSLILENEKYTKNGKPVKYNIQSTIDNYYKNKRRSNIKSNLESFVDDTNVKGSQDISNILGRYIDDSGNLKLNNTGDLSPLDRVKDSILTPNSTVIYNELEANISQRLNDYLRDNPGTKFIKDLNVYDSKIDKAGTIDLLAIKPSGHLDILDWTFISLNTNKYSDIPFQLQDAMNLELTFYRKTLENSYKLDKIDNSYSYPVLIKHQYKNKTYSLKRVQIGDKSVDNIEDDYLLPIAPKDQKTGNDIIDEQLSKIRGLYNKISTTNTGEYRRDIRKQELSKLFKTLRHLQIRKSFDPMFSYIDLLEVETDNLLSKYDALLRNIDFKVPSNEMLNDFSRKIYELGDKFDPFDDITVKLDPILGEDEKYANRLAQVSRKVAVNKNKIDNLIREFGSKYLGERNGVLSLALAEKEYKGIAPLFRPISKGGTYATTSLYNLTEPIINRIVIEQRQSLHEFSEIRNKYDSWAKTKGLSPKNMFDVILKRDSKGVSTNQLVNNIDKKFFKDFNEAKDNKNSKWFKDNIDLDAYEKLAKEYKARDLEVAKDFIYDSDFEKNEQIRKDKIAEISSRYDISTPKSFGWGDYLMQQFPKEDWYSIEYKKLREKGNEPALAFYNHIKQLNVTAAKLGIIQPAVKHSFLPFVRKNGIQEKLVFGGDIKLGKGLANSILVETDDYGYGYKDPVTGELIYDIYARYTNDFNDSNEVSTDLFKTIQLFTDEVIRYKNLREVTDSVKLLLRLESIKGSLQSNAKGEIVRIEGDAQSIDRNDNNYKLLLQHVMGRIYGISTDESEINLTSGKLGEGWDRNSEAINKFIGYNLFPTNLSGKVISAPKVIDATNHYFQAKVLSLNVGIFASNLVGGGMQSYINASGFYDKADLAKAQLKFASVAFTKEQDKALLALIETLHPFVEDRQRDRYIKVTSSKLANTNLIKDILMAPHKYGSMVVEYPHIIAMLEKAIVVDGQVYNVNKYIKDKYPNFYRKSPVEQSKLKEQMKKDKGDLLENNSLIKLAKVENGKLSIQGVELTSDSLVKYRSLIKNLSKDFLGGMESTDMTIASRNIIYKSFLVFKNWIPPLLDKRFGAIHHSPGIDSYEWGRARMVCKVIFGNGLRSAKILKNILSANKEGIDYITSLLEKKKEDYKLKTNKDLEISEDEFIDLVKSNVQNHIYDTLFFLFLASSLLAMHSLGPDKDEMNPEEKGYWNFSARIARKLFEEMSFYYNPMDFINIFNGSIFPGLGVVSDVYMFMKNVAQDGYGLATNNDELVEASHPAKYALKFSPLANNLSFYLAVASPQFAKEMGIKIVQNPNKR